MGREDHRRAGARLAQVAHEAALGLGIAGEVAPLALEDALWQLVPAAEPWLTPPKRSGLRVAWYYAWDFVTETGGRAVISTAEQAAEAIEGRAGTTLRA